jgi:hypothetical protein
MDDMPLAKENYYPIPPLPRNNDNPHKINKKGKEKRENKVVRSHLLIAP